MEGAVTVALPGAAVAAGADHGTVWCAAGGQLLAYDAGGSLLFELAAPDGLTSLAATNGTLGATLEPGRVAWLDPLSGRVGVQLAIDGEPLVVAGGGAVWAVDQRLGRAWRLVGVGSVAQPVSILGADLIAPDGGRIWWTSLADTLLWGADRPVDIGVGADDRSAIVACGGSVWISVQGGLVRVGTWAGELGSRLATPQGSIRFLACAQGILVGALDGHGLIILDPSIDVGIRHLDIDLGDNLAFLLATRSVVWAFPVGEPKAQLVSVRLGE